MLLHMNMQLIWDNFLPYIDAAEILLIDCNHIWRTGFHRILTQKDYFELNQLIRWRWQEGMLLRVGMALLLVNQMEMRVTLNGTKLAAQSPQQS